MRGDSVHEAPAPYGADNKLTICAALGVPELWRFNGRAFEIRLLKNGTYEIADESAIFPGMQLRDAVPKLVYLGAANGRASLIFAA